MDAVGPMVLPRRDHQPSALLLDEEIHEAALDDCTPPGIIFKSSDGRRWRRPQASFRSGTHSNAQAGVVDFKRTLARRSGKSTAASLGAGEGLSDGVGWQMRSTWHGSIWWLVAVR